MAEPWRPSRGRGRGRGSRGAAPSRPSGAASPGAPADPLKGVYVCGRVGRGEGRRPKQKNAAAHSAQPSHHHHSSHTHSPEAAALHDRGERRSGSDPAGAVALFDQAAALYRAVLGSLPPAAAPTDTHADAAGSLGEALQRRGEAVLAAAERDPGAGPATAREAAATASAAFEAAVAAYAACGPGPVPAPPQLAGGRGRDASLRLDAAVNAANTLCAWAAAALDAVDARDTGGALAASRAAGLARLDAAVTLYQGALAAEQGGGGGGGGGSPPDDLPDAGTAINLADALAQKAGLLAAAGTGADAVRGAFAAADAAYAAACAVSSSERGDDLPGLLLNWATATAAGAGALGGRPDLLATAAARFREAAAFGRGDPAPLVGLGDALAEMATASSPSSSHPPGAPNAEAAALLEAAATEGYGAALALDRRFADAHAGLGDVRLAQSRAAAGRGDAPSAAALAGEAAAAYHRALDVPPTSARSLGGWAARAEVRWNAACALALAGRADECVGALIPLLAAGGGAVGIADALRDGDLTGCPGVRVWLEARAAEGTV
jgi:trimeric autotransporter adhesin